MREVAVLGHLHCLWWWALDYAQDGDLTGHDVEDIAEGGAWDGEPQTFLDALQEAGFLDGMVVHDWNGGRHSKRERAAARVEWERIASRVRPVILARDGYKCVICGNTENLEVDHIVPLARMGTNDADNLQTLCRSCNRSKGADLWQ